MIYQKFYVTLIFILFPCYTSKNHQLVMQEENLNLQITFGHTRKHTHTHTSFLWLVRESPVKENSSIARAEILVVKTFQAVKINRIDSFLK